VRQDLRGRPGLRARRLAGELPPLLLPRAVSVEGEDQLTDLARPVPPPALDAENRHHTRHAYRKQRQRIKGAFADPQRPGACLQRRGVEVTLRARQMVVALGLRDLLRRAHCRASCAGGRSRGKGRTPAARGHLDQSAQVLRYLKLATSYVKHFPA
jgi:hypothetical protein